MADDLYHSLQSAWKFAQASESNVFGVAIAVVTNVQDPDHAGRVKICFPQLPGMPESDWARVAQPAAGPGRGFYWLPQVNDEVLVAFERGQGNRPYVIGSLWNGKDKPMKDAYSADNSIEMIQTKSGHRIAFYDKAGEEKIAISDKTGKRTVTFDVKNKKFLIEAKEGDFELHAEKKLALHCEELEVKTSKTGKIDVGTTFDLKVDQKAQIQAGPQLNIKAQRVDLNPPSLTVATVVAAAAGAVAGAVAGAAAGGASGAAAGAVAGASAGAAAGATVPSRDVAGAAAAGAAAGAGAGATAGASASAGPAGAAGPGATAGGAAPAASGAAAPASPAAGPASGAGAGAASSGGAGAAAAPGAQAGAAPASAPAAQPSPAGAGKTPSQPAAGGTSAAQPGPATGGAASAPAAAPSQPAAQPKGKKSGASWVKEFPGSDSTDDLAEPFGTNVKDFIKALEDAGATVSIHATYRPPERAYLMHWSWKIVKENFDPQQVPAKTGVEIVWWHGDQASSQKGAQEMVDGYEIGDLDVPPALDSRHTEKKAIDMNVSWSGDLKVKNKDGTTATITSSPHNQTNFDLIDVGKTYDVIHFGAQHVPLQQSTIHKDKPHFSTDGH